MQNEECRMQKYAVDTVTDMSFNWLTADMEDIIDAVGMEECGDE